MFFVGFSGCLWVFCSFVNVFCRVSLPKPSQLPVLSGDLYMFSSIRKPPKCTNSWRVSLDICDFVGFTWFNWTSKATEKGCLGHLTRISACIKRWTRRCL